MCNKEKEQLTIEEIMNIIPHRPPFLLVDKVIEKNNQHIVALKNVTMNEPFFIGHFPTHPVMPGVLIVEALAQAGAILLLDQTEHKGKIAYFGGIEKARFKQKVVPGDTLRLEVTALKVERGIGKAKGVAYVHQKVACRCEMTFICQ